MFFLQSIKYAFLVAFIISLLVYEISSGVFHGIKIPEDTQQKLVGNLDPEVELKQGVIQGKADISRNGRLYLSFMGIPFGKIPERFNNAVPADGWKGKLNAKEFGPPCAQFNFMIGQYSGQEDCLSVNVFVPKVEGKKDLLPVMVWVYGGAYIIGQTSTYGPKYFMDEDVILVSLNYRVGPFGFLNAGIKGASGNQGLKDLVLGLQWVQDNIATFGGDKSNVVIFGLSAGGGAVSHLLSSPMAKGLFHGAIVMSGQATFGWSLWPDPEFNEPKKLAYAVDCPTSNREYLVQCLRKTDPKHLAMAANFKDPVWFDREDLFVSAPGIETYFESENDTMVFQSENPENIWDKGTFNQVPILTGVTSHEGLLLHAAPILMNPNTTKKLNEQWGRVLPQALYYWSKAGANDPCVISSKLRQEYFQDRPVSVETAADLVNLYSDMAFQYPARKVALKASKFVPVYLYNFTRESRITLADLHGWWKTNPLLKPPTHGDDIQFLFNNLQIFPEIKRDSSEYEFSRNFVKLLTSFARDKKLTHVWGTKVESIEPISSSSEKLNWIQIDNELSVKPETEDFSKRMNVLDEICRDDFNYCSPLNMK